MRTDWIGMADDILMRLYDADGEKAFPQHAPNYYFWRIQLAQILKELASQ